MLRVFIILAAILISFNAEAQRKMDVLHYSHNIELNDSTDIISGSSVIEVLIENNTSYISFDLTNKNSNGKGMTVWSAGYMLKEKYFKDFEHSNDKLAFKGDFRSGDTITISVIYKGVPADGLIIAKNQFGKRTFFGDNWPNRAHNWLPCVDDPADKATVEFFVFAPYHYKVVSNGIMVQETPMKNNMKLTQWKEEVPLPTKVMVIGVADFAVNLSGMVNGCIPITSWVFPENIEGFMDYAIAKDILQWFIHYIGPYAYPKLANVQSKTIYGGMENAGAIFYAEHTVNGQQSEERLMAHEIAHQWFGNMATEKSFAHFWLSEGFATYLTHVYLESKYGTDSLNNRMQEDREAVLSFVKYAKRPVVDSTKDYMSLLNANSYQKGGWVLHMLRRQLGDSVFHKSIRDYYTQYAGKNAETKDLQRVFEKNAGKSLERFFQQWLYLPENPKLFISWQFLKREKKVAVTIEQKQANIFEFPLELLLIKGIGKNKNEKIFVSKRIETFHLPVTTEVLEIIADNNSSLLAEILVTNK